LAPFLSPPPKGERRGEGAQKGGSCVAPLPFFIFIYLKIKRQGGKERAYIIRGCFLYCKIKRYNKRTGNKLALL